MRELLSIIPHKFRRRSIAVSLTILLRALLNAVGIAALLPILYIILDADNIASNPLLGPLYHSSGLGSASAFVAVVAAAVVLFIIVKCVANLLLYRVERDYIFSLYRHLSRNLYIDYFERGLQFIKDSNTAILSRNVNVVCYTFVTGVLRPIATIASETILFALLFVAILCYNTTAALLALAILLPIAWLYFRLVRRQLDHYGNIENDAQRRKYRNVTESYRGYAEIEINNAFPKMLDSFDHEVDTIVGVGRKNATIATLPTMLTEIGLAVAMALLVCLGTQMGGGEIKILFGVFAVAALRLLPSIRNIMSAWTALRYNRYTINIIREAIVERPTRTTAPSTERIALRREINIDHLSFRFEGDEHDTLHELSLTIRRGEKIGINGRSGVGKTTLLNLLLGFYEPTAGAIYIDGERLTADNRRRWQNSIGYVSQSIFLTDSTLRENIALGCRADEIDEQRMARAVELASLKTFVDTLPKGLDTRIGECGALLSGGQRQRIGIARALYRQAEVLIFDEATSSLDNDTERGINEALEQLSHNNNELTMIVIAHRESSLGYCDRIVTLTKQE